MEQSFLCGYSGLWMVRLAFAAMVAVLFLQSGLDKLFNWKGEKEWLTGHFAKSFLKGMVPIMLPVITVLELAAGSCAAAGIFQLLLNGGNTIGTWGMVLGTKAIALLFFGQRVAKDYAGAASLVPYFLMCAAGMWAFMVA